MWLDCGAEALLSSVLNYRLDPAPEIQLSSTTALMLSLSPGLKQQPDSLISQEPREMNRAEEHSLPPTQ